MEIYNISMCLEAFDKEDEAGNRGRGGKRRWGGPRLPQMPAGVIPRPARNRASGGHGIAPESYYYPPTADTVGRTTRRCPQQHRAPAGIWFFRGCRGRHST